MVCIAAPLDFMLSDKNTRSVITEVVSKFGKPTVQKEFQLVSFGQRPAGIVTSYGWTFPKGTDRVIRVDCAWHKDKAKPNVFFKIARSRFPLGALEVQPGYKTGPNTVGERRQK